MYNFKLIKTHKIQQCGAGVGSITIPRIEILSLFEIMHKDI